MKSFYGIARNDYDEEARNTQQKTNGDDKTYAILLLCRLLSAKELFGINRS